MVLVDNYLNFHLGVEEARFISNETWTNFLKRCKAHDQLVYWFVEKREGYWLKFGITNDIGRRFSEHKCVPNLLFAGVLPCVNRRLALAVERRLKGHVDWALANPALYDGGEGVPNESFYFQKVASEEVADAWNAIYQELCSFARLEGFGKVISVLDKNQAVGRRDYSGMNLDLNLPSLTQEEILPRDRVKKKDKRKKVQITVRFPLGATGLIEELDDLSQILTEEMSEELGHKVSKLARNDVAAWCLQRGIKSLRDGERPPMIAGSPKIG